MNILQTINIITGYLTNIVFSQYLDVQVYIQMKNTLIKQDTDFKLTTFNIIGY